MGDKTFDFSRKNLDFLRDNDKFWPEIGIFVHFGQGLAGSFGALLVSWLVVVARAVSCKTPIYFMYLVFC